MHEYRTEKINLQMQILKCDCIDVAAVNFEIINAKIRWKPVFEFAVAI